MLEVNEKRKFSIFFRCEKYLRNFLEVTSKQEEKRRENIDQVFFCEWKDDAKINGVSLVHSESVLVSQSLLFLTGQVSLSYYCHFQDTTWNWSKAAIKLYFTSQESHSCLLPNSSIFYWSTMIKSSRKTKSIKTANSHKI